LCAEMFRWATFRRKHAAALRHMLPRDDVIRMSSDYR